MELSPVPSHSVHPQSINTTIINQSNEYIHYTQGASGVSKIINGCYVAAAAAARVGSVGGVVVDGGEMLSGLGIHLFAYLFKNSSFYHVPTDDK